MGFVSKTLRGGVAGVCLSSGRSDKCHAPLLHQVTCSVHSGSTLIDLTPLIHVSGFYTAEGLTVTQNHRTPPQVEPASPGGFCLSPDEAVGQSANSTDFYINICQPLNSIPGVACPPGAAVCMDPVDGPPVVRTTLIV